MFVGVARYEIFIPSSSSLKDKRQVLRSVIATVRKKFNAAIAEIDHQDLWQRSALGVSVVSSEQSHCREVLSEVEKAIGRSIIGNAEVVDRSVEIVSMDDFS
jgi:uncharacterized protein